MVLAFRRERVEACQLWLGIFWSSIKSFSPGALDFVSNIFSDAEVTGAVFGTELDDEWPVQFWILEERGFVGETDIIENSSFLDT